MAKTKNLFYITLAVLVMTGSVMISGCALFESAVKTGKIELSYSKCDSAKITTDVFPAFPKFNFGDSVTTNVFTKWNAAEQCYYVHSCISGKVYADAGASDISGWVAVISRLLDRVWEIIKFFYQIKN